MKNQPLVSIITPCFNSELYIAETLESVISQDYQNWECIVVDDGSTDNSASIVKEIIAKEARIKYIHQQNSGASTARNKGILKSQGKYILPLDSDDLIHSTYLSKAVEIFEASPTTKIVYCDVKLFGDKNKDLIHKDYSFENLIIQNMLIVSSMYRREDYNKTAGYDPKMFSSEDWEFWISLLKDGGEVYKIPEQLLYYRKHGGSKSKKNHKKRELLRKYVFQKHKELYLDLFDNPIQIYFEHKKFKKYYNLIRRLTFRQPIK
jgi:glycosyltransferase involved in cell wall biosynthesis